MSDALHIDLESRSTVDLTKTGVYPYAMHPDTGLWCAAYCFNDEPVQTWHPHQPRPERIAHHVSTGGRVLAWNSQFERTMWQHILTERYGWPMPRLEQWDDPMVWALAMGLPGQLGQCAIALGIPQQKDDAGRRLMLQMAKPRRVRNTTGIVWWDDPERIARLTDYCKTDVEVERALSRILLPLSDEEREHWLRDQRTNDRGIQVDLRNISACREIADKVLAELDTKMDTATGGEVSGCSQVVALADFLRRNGYPVTSLDKEHLETYLKDPALPAWARRLLLLRQTAAKASLGKLDAMERTACNDGRIRGMFRFHKASTGRWSSVGVQLQNFTRGAKDLEDVPAEEVFDACRTGDVTLVRALYGDPLDAISSKLRGLLMAKHGHTLVDVDFSQIESRIIAWLGGEQWKLEAFRLFDLGLGPDNYALAYGRSFGVDPATVKGNQRQIGKCQDLSLGFQGGAGAFAAMAETYRIDLEPLADAVLPTLPEDVLDSAAWMWGWAQANGRTGDLPERIFMACDGLKQLWRRAHPGIVQLWTDLEEASIAATQQEGQVFRVAGGKLGFKRSGHYLWCRLPSGRLLCYPFPVVKREQRKDGTEGKLYLSAMGVNSVTQRFERYAPYGGFLAENVTQAIGADLQRNAMANMEGDGLDVVLHAHDEACCEVPLTMPNALERVRAAAVRVPAWTAGLPVAAGGWVGPRFKKD